VIVNVAALGGKRPTRAKTKQSFAGRVFPSWSLGTRGQGNKGGDTPGGSTRQGRSRLTGKLPRVTAFVGTEDGPDGHVVGDLQGLLER
jgi:hypothetical protein